jgi:hypothetical protein
VSSQLVGCSGGIDRHEGSQASVARESARLRESVQPVALSVRVGLTRSWCPSALPREAVPDRVLLNDTFAERTSVDAAQADA